MVHRHQLNWRQFGMGRVNLALPHCRNNFRKFQRGSPGGWGFGPGVLLVVLFLLEQQLQDAESCVLLLVRVYTYLKYNNYRNVYRSVMKQVMYVYFKRKVRNKDSWKDTTSYSHPPIGWRPVSPTTYHRWKLPVLPLRNTVLNFTTSIQGLR